MFLFVLRQSVARNGVGNSKAHTDKGEKTQKESEKRAGRIHDDQYTTCTTAGENSITAQQGRAKCRAEVVGPDEESEKSFPEGKLEKSDGEEPTGTPCEPYRAMLFDAYLLHAV